MFSPCWTSEASDVFVIVPFQHLLFLIVDICHKRHIYGRTRRESGIGPQRRSWDVSYIDILNTLPQSCRQQYSTAFATLIQVTEASLCEPAPLFSLPGIRSEVMMVKPSAKTGV